MIIVTGATGRLGRLIVEHLVTLVPASDIGVSVRDPAKAADLARVGIRVRRGDFDDPASLRAAFEGASQVLVVSSNARASGGDPLIQHRTAVMAAKQAGVERIHYTSHMAASAVSAFPPARDHAATEEMLAECGLAWTALRHGFYAESGLMMIGDALDKGLIETPSDGKVSWTTHEDLAEADATILAQAFRGTGIVHDGATPPLTAAEAVDHADIATIASEASGRTIGRAVLSDDDFTARMAARGAPEGMVRMALGLYIASRNGEFATVDPTLEVLLGRRPSGMRELVAARSSSRD